VPFAAGLNIPERLGEAMCEEVTARLSDIAPPWLSVLTRDSVFALARRGLSAVRAREALRAELVLAEPCAHSSNRRMTPLRSFPEAPA
jgi:hypothetical protein